ncbi:MAG: alanine--tRNA ligase [Candidatus Magasanikbacteria bacterium CG10_big_fil_rev_8_21_14_0_10_42_10]|uniref:alanine--tRNA ligase n=2 Tax=Candidatus Magasanikiibacteriota TaxID=1752731 RepID=A0A2H0TX29_9BACT|nr:MAG: alanine--tRNA ligase [Candidatus Magasanikbacteria bacterium CG10_big_fil_rev_8_21_14_0_10_42_10]PIZ94765.1 MAG: alanine--tRNA ligase [Candidatus Magasanikbacteria bacterium CG_4_10_14_0_2_um_filter_41_10]
MTANDIRSAYLAFFEKQGHTIIPSSSLVPEHDPTTLFTGSGMQPILPYLLGQPHPSGSRLTDSQKCFRSQDIEEVGDNRHTTFFEMLGNWSFGDYFKKEQIPWLFQFLVEDIGLDPSKLYVTCYAGNEEFDIPKDMEAAALWQTLFQEKNISHETADMGSEAEGYARGMKDGERIFFYDGKKNWWSRGGSEATTPVGDPGGPDTEVFYDFGGEHDTTWGAHCHPNCDCGRFMEIANSVFMAYKRTESGFEKLEKQNVDFGGGLERVVAAMNKNPDVFLIDLFDDPRQIIESQSGKTYGESKDVTHNFRIMLDHLRAAVFLIGDGVYPSNKDQGYFARRLVRRAVRAGHKLGIEKQVTAPIAAAFITTYSDAYPYLKETQSKIEDVLDGEEKKFRGALARGEKEFGKIEPEIKKTIEKGGEHVIDYIAKMSFDLYQTFGLPFEVFTDLLQKTFSEQAFDENELTRSYDTIFEEHQALSRQGADKKFKGGLADHSDMSVKYHTATHLLHAAVLELLSPDAFQKGSNITPERLRFDFAYDKKITDDEIKAIEDLVNAAIKKDYPVSFQMLSVEDARAKGAIGLFDASYDEKVKVYTIGDPDVSMKADVNHPTFSQEFCGGPHVEHTGVLGTFKITKEEAVSAGIRRIRAILE